MKATIEMYMGDVFADKVQIDVLYTLSATDKERFYKDAAWFLIKKHRKKIIEAKLKPQFFVRLQSRMNVED